MAGAQILASIKKQGEFAGNTSATSGAAPPPPAMTGAEALSLTNIRTELDGFVAGGIHPESLLQPVSRALARASDGLPGPHGGMIPSMNGVSTPGPAGETLAAQGRVLVAKAQAALKRLV